MKKLASLLLTAVLLATMLCVFAVPASAEDTPIECTPDTSDAILISDAKNYIISQDLNINALYVENSNATLTIAEGKTVTVREIFNLKAGKVVLNGTLNIGQCNLQTGLDKITFGETGKLVWEASADDGNEQVISINPKDPTDKAFVKVIIPKDPGAGSVLSEGSLAVIVGIAAAVVFGLGGFFIGKAAGKKKKPTLASCVEDTDEE